MHNHSKPVIPFPDALMAGAEARPIGFEPLIDVEEAARLLGGIHPKTLMRWARQKEVPAYQIGRFWCFRASELNHWLVSSRQPIRPH